MKHILSAAVVAAALLAASGALAEDEPKGMHIELGVQTLFLEGGTTQTELGPSTGPDHRLNVMVLRLGYDLAPHLVIEGEFMTGVNNTDVTAQTPVGDISFNARLTRAAGLLMKAWYPVFDGGVVHARLGAVSHRVRVSTDEEHVDGGADGIAFGVGAEMEIGRDLCLRFDLTRYRDSDGDADGVSVTLVRHF